MAIRIVTDSTSDLPPEVVRDLDLAVVPCSVQWGGQTFRDGVDLTPQQFYDRLVRETVLPTTSQPPAGAFVEVYRPLLEAGHQVLSIHISGKLSGTMNSAQQAREECGTDAPVELLDSQQTSWSLGLVVLEAARAAQAGASLQETMAVARLAVERVRLYFLLETLEYLQRGGRIGRAQAFLGSLLHVRPILTMEDGEVHPLERVRSRQRGIERLLELAQESAPLQQVGVCYTTTREDAEALQTRAQGLTPNSPILLSRVGPALGTHGGPGALGMAVLAE